MDVERSERDEYLDRYFPAFVPVENHAPGRFAECVLEALMAAYPIEVNLRDAGTRYVVIDKIELGGTPVREEVQIRFRLAGTRPEAMTSVESISWGGLDQPIKGSLAPVYFFTMGAESDPGRVVEELITFTAEHLDDHAEHLDDHLLYAQSPASVEQPLLIEAAPTSAATSAPEAEQISAEVAEPEA